MALTHDNPSARYRSLIDLYRRMHLEGDVSRNASAQTIFPGISLRPHVSDIKRLVGLTRAQSLLDYGSGKGMLYREQPFLIGDSQWESVADYWDVDYVACYDPSYPPYSERPAGRFDGVICTDVLEHCPEEDLDWIVDDLFRYGSRFVFASIAGFPAMKSLPNGENAHCTVRPATWWNDLFQNKSMNYSGTVWQVRYFGASVPGRPANIETLGSPQ